MFYLKNRDRFSIAKIGRIFYAQNPKNAQKPQRKAVSLSLHKTNYGSSIPCLTTRQTTGEIRQTSKRRLSGSSALSLSLISPTAFGFHWAYVGEMFHQGLGKIVTVVLTCAKTL